MRKQLFLFSFIVLLYGPLFSTITDEYENYATLEYKGYPRKGTDVYDWYDPFGEKLITGYSVYDFYDINSRGILIGGESQIFKSYRYNRWLYEFIVISDEFGGMKNRLTIGDELKTKFSSLTLSKAGINGIRWDVSTKNDEFTIVFSRLSEPGIILNTAWQDEPKLYLKEKSSIYLVGMYNKLSLFNQSLGVTYVNIHQDENNIEKASLYGVGAGITGIGVGGINLTGGVKDVNYRLEYALSNEYTNGSPSNVSFPAFALQLGYKWNNLSLKGYYYNIDPSYSTTFFSGGKKLKYDSFGEEIDVYHLVDDNDDNDQFPDNIDQKPWEWYLANKYIFYNWPDGVFPGADKNNNGVSDYNENRNAYPDYEEDFLRYYVDPPQFEAGDDLNNNGIIDALENDDYPDYKIGSYPLRKDRKGMAVFAEYTLLPDLKLQLQVVRDNLVSNSFKKARTYNLNALYHTTITGFGKLNLEWRGKMVRDELPDDTIEYSVSYQYGRPQTVYTVISDKLSMRNSLVNSIFLNLLYNRFLNLDVETKVKYEVNVQEWQQEEFRRTSMFFGMINRVKYDLILSDDFTISPMIKTQYEKRSGEINVDSITNVYILRGVYKLTKKTKLSAGVQFMPVYDLIDNSRDFNKVTYLLQVMNNSLYLKYNIALLVGISREVFQFKASPQETVDSIFLRVYLGG